MGLRLFSEKRTVRFTVETDKFGDVDAVVRIVNLGTNDPKGELWDVSMIINKSFIESKGWISHQPEPLEETQVVQATYSVETRKGLITNYSSSKKGHFVTNKDRWIRSGMKETTTNMYDCVDCLRSGTPHSIIEVPGPPADGNEHCIKGEPTTINRCTGCGAETGPWVRA